MVTGILVALGAFALNMALAFLLMYCFDTAELWKKCDTDSKLPLPQVEDLADADVRQISRYVTLEICPAYHYMKTVDEVSSLQRHNSDSWLQMGAWLFLQVPVFLMIPKGLYQIGFTHSPVLCVVIALAACLAGVFIVSKVYKKKLKISDFYYSKDDMKKQFIGWEEHRAACGYKPEGGFDITEDAKLNNYMIGVHSQYIYSIIDTVRARAAVRRVIVIIVACIYILIALGHEE